MEAFYTALQEQQKENKEEVDFYVTLLVSMADYHNFLLMMRDFKSKQAK